MVNRPGFSRMLIFSNQARRMTVCGAPQRGVERPVSASQSFDSFPSLTILREVLYETKRMTLSLSKGGKPPGDILCQ